MISSITSESILHFVASLVALLIARTAWKRSEISGARTFAGLLLAAAWWAFFGSLEFATTNIEMRVFWAKVEYLGIASIPPLWFLFTLQYSQHPSRNDRRFTFLMIVPVVMLMLVFTNEWHHLIWQSVHPVEGTERLAVEYDHGIGFWILTVYNYIILLTGTFVLVIAAIRFPALYRRQATSIIAGALIPWISNLLYILNIGGFGIFDPTPVSFVLTGAIFAIGVFRFYLFDVVPIAQDSVIESMRDGVIVFDPNGRLAYSNPAARSMLPAVTWTERSPDKVFEAYPEIKEASQDNHLVSDGIEIGEQARRIIELHNEFITGPGGEINGRVMILRDITERKKFEERLLIQSVALDSAANGIIITDRDGITTYINKGFTEITGCLSEDIIGKNPRILKSQIQHPEFYEKMWNTILAGKVWSGELINRRKNGSLYPEEQAISPVLNSSGRITHFIGIKQDISERKHIEQMRDDLMKALVHDLRNPLNSILLSLEMFSILPESGAENITTEQMLQVSKDNVRRMMGMVNAILDVGRLESGQMPLNREMVNLIALVEKTRILQEPLAERNNIQVLNTIPHDLPPVFVDLGLISRTFQNLIDNAIKFTPTGGKIEINARYHEDKQHFLISIKDSGHGIDSSLLPRVFDKYAVGDSPRRGTGLGLAFCRLAVEAHGGKIWVESNPSEGTTFLFTLPILY